MGGKSSDEQTVRNEPWGGVQGPLKDLYSMTGQALGNRLPYYPNQTYANFTPLQEAGMFGNLDYAQNYYSPATMGYQQSLADYMDAPLNIAKDPAVQSMMAANQQNATDWLTQKALPSITTGSVAAGQLGGSRQGIAQGQAIGDAAKALTQANAQTMLGALDPMTRLAGYASNALPGALQMGFTPGDLAMQYGGNYQNMAGQGITEAMNRYYYPEQSLWDKLGKASGIYSGAGSYGTQSTELPGTSPLAGAVGGGLTGYGAMQGLAAMTGGNIPTLAATAAVPWLPWVAGGALLGGLFS